jgi:UDP:flavonoid glycosyltransferase YjiC (YdhE family)
MPYAFDQPDNAARVRRIGVGLSVSRRRYKADVAAKRIDTLLNTPGYMDRAAEVGRRVSAENSLSIACDSVDRALKS